MMLDDSLKGLNIKIARDERDAINKSSHDELIQRCIDEEISYDDLTDSEMRIQLKQIMYEDLDREDIELLNKEEPLSNEQIEKYNQDKIYGTE